MLVIVLFPYSQNLAAGVGPPRRPTSLLPALVVQDFLWLSHVLPDVHDLCDLGRVTRFPLYAI